MEMFATKLNRPEFSFTIGDELYAILLQYDISLTPQVISNGELYQYLNLGKGIYAYVQNSRNLNISIVIPDTAIATSSFKIEYSGNSFSSLIRKIEVNNASGEKLSSSSYDILDDSIVFKWDNVFDHSDYPLILSIELGKQDVLSMASAMSISASDRDIYRSAPGDARFAVFLFQGLYEDPTTHEVIVDYPLNTWKGIPVAGTVPLSSSLALSPQLPVGDTLSTDDRYDQYIHAYEMSEGLDSLTIIIEFVCNKTIGVSCSAPNLYYDVIPPVYTAQASKNNEAEFIGNVNGVSVYRGYYTIHKQSKPLYVDGIHKIELHMLQQQHMEFPIMLTVFGRYAIISEDAPGNGQLLA